MKKRICIFTACVLVIGIMAFAQQPASTSPAGEVTAAVKIDGNNISVKYFAASRNGRKIFGGVVPYDKVWRIGEKGATAFHTDADLVFKGLVVKKGDYALFVLPGAEKWQLIFAKPAALQSPAFDSKLELGRANMTLTKSADAVETCKLTLTKTATVAGKLELIWENTVAAAPFYIDKGGNNVEW